MVGDQIFVIVSGRRGGHIALYAAVIKDHIFSSFADQTACIQVKAVFSAYGKASGNTVCHLTFHKACNTANVVRLRALFPNVIGAGIADLFFHDTSADGTAHFTCDTAHTVGIKKVTAQISVCMIAGTAGTAGQIAVKGTVFDDARTGAANAAHDLTADGARYRAVFHRAGAITDDAAHIAVQTHHIARNIAVLDRTGHIACNAAQCRVITTAAGYRGLYVTVSDNACCAGSQTAAAVIGITHIT